MNSENLNYCFFIFSSVIFAFHLASADAVVGSVSLNSGTFDKVVSRFQVALIKFDRTNPSYGERYDAFENVAESAKSQNDLLVAEVNVQDYGENFNAEIAERFKIKKDDYPDYLLFLNGNLDQSIKYSGDKSNAEEIQQFVVKHSDIWLGLPGCLEAFDKLVHSFLKGQESRRSQIIGEAKELIKSLRVTMTTTTDLDRAEYYVKTMQKLLDKVQSSSTSSSAVPGHNGNGIDSETIDQETERLGKLVTGKVSEKKKSQLKERLNILKSFRKVLDGKGGGGLRAEL